MSNLTKFSEMSLAPHILSSLEAMQFVEPTPIQSMAIPAALNGKDIIASAQTGTGKTAAFCLPIISKMTHTPDRQALILVPTRELAQQIGEFLKLFNSKETSYCTLIGGSSFGVQVKQIRNKPSFILATPGRLIDHLQQKTISLEKVKYLVLDEADRMLDMGFATQLAQVAKHLSPDRQNFLFSATFPPNIIELSKMFMRSPVEIKAPAKNLAVESVKQSSVFIGQEKKNETLVDELNKREGSVLVFTRTKRRTDQVAKHLVSYGFKVDRIHGDRTQAQRSKAVSSLKTGFVRILIATDVAARGIDISSVSHVINFDLPQDPEDYIHRIGRTGRAGRTGEALSFVSPNEEGAWKAIQRILLNNKLDNKTPGAPRAGASSSRSSGGGAPRSASGGGESRGRSKSGRGGGGKSRFGNKKSGSSGPSKFASKSRSESSGEGQKKDSARPKRGGGGSFSKRRSESRRPRA